MAAEKLALHALIAYEQDLAQQSKAIMEEADNTFLKKQDHFDGVQKVYNAFVDGGEKIPPEVKEVVTTVEDKLAYTQKAVIKAINATLSKEETNASGVAKASLIVDGINFGDFSATSFISLERSLNCIRNLYKSIPTLDPTKTWTKKDSTGRVLYETASEVKFRTNKKQIPLVLAPATDKFAAQVQIVTTDEQVGQYDTVYRSGRLTPLEKSNLLEKIDNLIIAVKKAREKANQADVVSVEVGGKIFDYIHGVL